MVDFRCYQSLCNLILCEKRLVFSIFFSDKKVKNQFYGEVDTFFCGWLILASYLQMI